MNSNLCKILHVSPRSVHLLLVSLLSHALQEESSIASLLPQEFLRQPSKVGKYFSNV